MSEEIELLEIKSGETFDAREIPPTTVRTCVIHPGASLIDPDGKLTFLNGVRIIDEKKDEEHEEDYRFDIP